MTKQEFSRFGPNPHLASETQGSRFIFVTTEIQKTPFVSSNINVKLISFQKYLSTGNWLNSGVFQGFKDISGVFQGHSHHSIQSLFENKGNFMRESLHYSHNYINHHISSFIFIMTSTRLSQDIQSNESIWQVEFIDIESIVNTSRDMTFSQAVFLSHFSSQVDLGDKYLLIQNDPVTLIRAEMILKMRLTQLYHWFDRKSLVGFAWGEIMMRPRGICFMRLLNSRKTKQYVFARDADTKSLILTWRQIRATQISGNIIVNITTDVHFLKSIN